MPFEINRARAASEDKKPFVPAFEATPAPIQEPASAETPDPFLGGRVNFRPHEASPYAEQMARIEARERDLEEGREAYLRSLGAAANNVALPDILHDEPAKTPVPEEPGLPVRKNATRQAPTPLPKRPYPVLKAKPAPAYNAPIPVPSRRSVTPEAKSAPTPTPEREKRDLMIIDALTALRDKTDAEFGRTKNQR